MGIADLKRLNIRVTPEMHKWIQTNAEMRGITLNAMCIFALETYIQQQMMMPLLPDMLEEMKRNYAKEENKN
jgi:uncharacterized protein (DUF1778 family)